MRGRASMCLLLCLAGCSTDPTGTSAETTVGSSDGGSETATSESGAQTETETETGAPPCVVEDCASQCSDGIDECLQPLVPICTEAGECDCVQEQACPPCDEADCERFEDCTGDGVGVCAFQFCGFHEAPIWLEMPGSCEVSILGFPPDAASSVGITVDGMYFGVVDDCADEPPIGAWTWIVEAELIGLCPLMCASFEQGTETNLTWGIPCE